jgi:transcriptional regulator with XRE-family HTH domain
MNTTSDALWESARAQALLNAGDVGGAIRLARQARGWRQEDLGAATGYSRSTISRLETGSRAGTDISMIRTVAAQAGVPPAFLGAALQILSPPPTTVAATAPPVEEDNVRRRELLTLGGAAIVSVIPGRAAASTVAGPVGGELLNILTASGPDIRPWTSARLQAAYQHVATAFTECRYQEAATALTTLTAAAQTTYANANGNAKDFATGILVRAYALCSKLSVKAAEDSLAWVTADRAFTVADNLGDPLLLGIAARQAAIAMRRTGHHSSGLHLLQTTASKLDSHTGTGSPPLLAVLGSLHTAAAFNHAQTGHTHAALEAIGRARELAVRLGDHKTLVITPFSTTTVTEYEISVRNALGDHSGALQAAALIEPGALPTPERLARYGLDVARAWHHHGRPDKALHALIQAERHGPEDVRRPSVRALITEIASASSPPAGAREFAARTGATP